MWHVPARRRAVCELGQRRIHRAGPPCGERRLRVGYLGRLTPSKGIATLCQAMSSLNSNGIGYDLVIGGEPVFASDEERAEG